MQRAPKGLVYTILVDGKPIVTLEASSQEAAELCKEEWFRAELSALNFKWRTDLRDRKRDS